MTTTAMYRRCACARCCDEAASAHGATFRSSDVGPRDEQVRWRASSPIARRAYDRETGRLHGMQYGVRCFGGWRWNVGPYWRVVDAVPPGAVVRDVSRLLRLVVALLTWHL